MRRTSLLLSFLLIVAGCGGDSNPDANRMQRDALRQNDARSRQLERDRERLTAQRERQEYDRDAAVDRERTPGQ